MKPISKLMLMSLLCGVFYTAQGQTVLERSLVNSSAVENEVFSLVYDNPAMKFQWHAATLTELYVGGEYQKEDLPTLVQEGDGLRFGTVNVSSYICNKKNRLWGQAYYKNGERLGRCWNETSDYKLLYPYVMGDTIGGNLKSEQYFFAGGYARNIGKYLIGIEGSYKAMIEYRNADPRPKNLTGDLNARLGAARYLGKKFLLGMGVYARKYKQTNDLVFYDELGVPNIFHFTGLGTDYYRFRGAKGESFYKGHAFGGSIDLLPATNAGVSAAIHYDNFQFDKVISTLNELPMASVKEDYMRGEIAWKKQKIDGWQWGTKGIIGYTRRVGTENLFGASTGNIYPLVSSQKKYMNEIYKGEISGVLEYTSVKGLRAAFLPQLGYIDIHTSYNAPYRKMQVGMIQPGFRFRMAYPYHKWLFSGETGVEFRCNVSSSLDIAQGVREGEEYLNHPTLSNYEALKVNKTGGHIQLRANYSWNKKYGLYLAAQYHYQKDRRSSESQYVNGQIGFMF